MSEYQYQRKDGLTSYDDDHKHVYVIDMHNGNGMTSMINGHRHEIINHQIIPVDNSSHELDLSPIKKGVTNKLSRLERTNDIKGKIKYHAWPMSQKPRRQDFIDISTYYLKSNFRKPSILFDDRGVPFKQPPKKKRK